MENFETLRKDWNSLEAGAGSGGSVLLRPAEDIFVRLSVGWEGEEYTPGDTCWLYPYGGENEPMTMRELLALGAAEKVVIAEWTYQGAPNYTPVAFFVMADDSWSVKILIPHSESIANGNSLDDVIRSGGAST